MRRITRPTRKQRLQRDRQKRYISTPKGKYMLHKHSAKQRGIEFLLTFEQWLELWKPHWEDRGKCPGCKVMGRKGDIGPYAIGNVEIITHEENQRARYASHS